MTATNIIRAQPAPKSFEEDAYSFLVKFAHRKRGHSFSAEMVTLAADGYIRRSDVLFPRSMGNGTLSPGWTET